MRIEEEFWSYFQENTLILQRNQLKDGSSRSIHDKLQQKLELIHPHIEIEFQLNQEVHPQVIFTANGFEEAFPAISRLLNFAPNLDPWQIVPFRQRSDYSDGVEFEGLVLKPQTVHFHYEKLNNGRVNLDLYCENTEDHPLELVESLAIKLLELAIGEFDLVHRVEELYFHKISDPHSPHLLPFHEIGEVIDSLKKARV